MAAYPPCARHGGRHMDVRGQCVHWGAPYAIRPGVCLTCNAPIMNRLDLQTGRTDVIEEGSEARHVHTAPATVDPHGLADGIAEALDLLMRKRGRQAPRREPEPVAYGSTMSGQRPAQPLPRDDFEGIVGVPVVRPDGAG